MVKQSRFSFQEGHNFRISSSKMVDDDRKSINSLSHTEDAISSQTADGAAIAGSKIADEDDGGRRSAFNSRPPTGKKSANGAISILQVTPKTMSEPAD